MVFSSSIKKDFKKGLFRIVSKFAMLRYKYGKNLLSWCIWRMVLITIYNLGYACGDSYFEAYFHHACCTNDDRFNSMRFLFCEIPAHLRDGSSIS